MSRRTAWIEAYAVVRRDRFPGHQYDPDSSDPPMICGGEYSYSVKEVVLTLDVARREVDRLNSLNGDKECRYFLEYTHLFAAGGSAGEEPRDEVAR